MRILAVVHERDAGVGVFAEPAAAAGHEIVEWVPSADGAAPALDAIDAAMVFGGSMNVDEESDHAWLAADKALIRSLLAEDVPTLGVCLGAQLLAEAAGTQPRRAPRPEIGWHTVTLTDAAAGDPLISPLPREFTALGWHSYEAPLPAGATALATSAVCLQAYRLADARAWGVQFHPEVTAADFATWLAHHVDDADALDIDVDAIERETRERIAWWNDLGRGLAARFYAAATA